MTGYPSNMDAHGPMRSEQQAREDVLARVLARFRARGQTLSAALAASEELFARGWTYDEAERVMRAALREGGESE